MDGHVRVCEELFSAARGEFKHLEHFYFHNCTYGGVYPLTLEGLDQAMRELSRKK